MPEKEPEQPNCDRQQFVPPHSVTRVSEAASSSAPSAALRLALATLYIPIDPCSGLRCGLFSAVSLSATATTIYHDSVTLSAFPAWWTLHLPHWQGAPNAEAIFGRHAGLCDHRVQQSQ